jgi:hypothetical protein
VEDCFNGFRILGRGLNRVHLCVEAGVLSRKKAAEEKHNGYFDQMHMIRDFKNLGGGAPSQLSEQIGDLRPWSLATPMTLCDLSEPPHRVRHRK